MQLLRQDGDAEPVAAVARQLAPAFLRSARGFEFWQKTPRVPALSEKQPGHAWLAQHYKCVRVPGWRRVLGLAGRMAGDVYTAGVTCGLFWTALFVGWEAALTSRPLLTALALAIPCCHKQVGPGPRV